MSFTVHSQFEKRKIMVEQIGLQLNCSRKFGHGHDVDGVNSRLHKIGGLLFVWPLQAEIRS